MNFGTAIYQRQRKEHLIIGHSLFEIGYSVSANCRWFPGIETKPPSWGLPDASRYTGGDSLRYPVACCGVIHLANFRKLRIGDYRVVYRFRKRRLSFTCWQLALEEIKKFTDLPWNRNKLGDRGQRSGVVLSRRSRWLPCYSLFSKAPRLFRRRALLG